MPDSAGGDVAAASSSTPALPFSSLPPSFASASAAAAASSSSANSSPAAPRAAAAASEAARVVHLPALWLDYFDTAVVHPELSVSQPRAHSAAAAAAAVVASAGADLPSPASSPPLSHYASDNGTSSSSSSNGHSTSAKASIADSADAAFTVEGRVRRSAARETFTKVIRERRSAVEEELDSPAQLRFSPRGQPQLTLEAAGFSDFANSLKDSMSGAFLQRETRDARDAPDKGLQRGSTKHLRAQQAYSSGKSSLHHAHTARKERVAFYRIKLKSGHEEGAYGSSHQSSALQFTEGAISSTSHSMFHGEAREACENLVKSLLLREKWQQDMHSHHRFPEELEAARDDDHVRPSSTSAPPALSASAGQGAMADVSQAMNDLTFEFREGVCHVIKNGTVVSDYAPLSLTEFSEDFRYLRRVMANGPTKTFTYTRLKVLEHKFEMHQRMNRMMERNATRNDPQDFTTIHKVDTHVHLAAGMTAAHMIDFVKRTLVKHGNDVVFRSSKRDQRTGVEHVEEKILADVFDELATGAALSVNALDVEADEAFMRFDIFNKKYNIFGQSGLRNLFLKSDNEVDGLYFAELTKELLTEVRQRKIQTEYRLSIYGRSPKEWDKLAHWVVDNDLISTHNRYLIQLPRLYSMWKAQNAISSFQEMLENMFLPLFEVTRDPSSNPTLHRFLQECSGFDSVDDESKLEIKLFPATGEVPPVNRPDRWTGEHDPPFSYYMYYTYANLFALNQLRKSRGFNTFDFRPHAGESGDADHLASAFLLARGVNHGINLDSDTVLQYLYYLAQVGLAVSPLSNNSLFLDYKRNPFPRFFRRGLNVSLSTDDPLQFHITDVPLLEEYSIASKRWNLTDIDMSEIARNSVLQSGFGHETKQRWLGERYVLPGVAGNDCRFSNLPDIRAAYRFENLQAELAYITACMAHLNDDVPTRVDIVSPFDFWSRDVITRGLPAPPTTSSFSGQTISASHADLRTGHLLTAATDARSKYMRYLQGQHGGGGSGIDASAYSTENKHECRAQGGVYHVFLNERSMCQHCSDMPASVSCEKCHLRYCDDCDRVLHRRPMYRSHARSRVRPGQPLFQLPSVEEFRNDYNFVDQLRHNSDVFITCSMRLSLSQSRYVFNSLLNARLEKEAMKLAHKGARTVDAVDFYQVIKVDNHVHASSFASASHFCEFVRKKITDEPDEIVWRGGKDESTFVTLAEAFERLSVDRQHITVDSMNIRADRSSTFRNFDALVNSKYTPFGNAEFGQIFLKKENAVNGRYFAELIAEALQKTARLRTTRTELRISIHGHTRGEWAELASWLTHYQLLQIHTKRNDRERPQPVNRFVVQVPRNYAVWRRFGRVSSFQDMLDNIFEPLFDAIQNPVNNDLTAVLQAISGFDSVDDESDTRDYWPEGLPTPDEWTSDENPPYAYYMYYMWANIAQLNAFRRMKGSDSGDVQPYSFRPHAGADGSASHLSATFLVADSINHGLKLKDSATLQYLYFINQIGVAMSPLAEDSVYMNYKDNPFKDLFERGLRVSLTSDNPMQTHSTDDPLLEEYSIAAKMWKFTNTDLSEIARNSVLISGFSNRDKRLWLGPKFEQPGTKGNDPAKSNVPQLRVHFRQQVLDDEHQWLRQLDEAYGKVEPASDSNLPTVHRHISSESRSQARHSPEQHARALLDETGASNRLTQPLVPPFVAALGSSTVFSVVVAAGTALLVSYLSNRWRQAQ